MHACAECGRVLPADIVFTPVGAPLVCDAHVEATQLMGRRRSSAMAMLAQKHGGPVAVVAVSPLDRTDHDHAHVYLGETVA